MENSVFCVHRMVDNDFNPASVIWCHDSIGAVVYVRRSEVSTIKVLSVPKTTPHKLLASDGYLRYVENHPLVFGTITPPRMGETEYIRASLKGAHASGLLPWNCFCLPPDPDVSKTRR
jgi:hypothetical protein